MNKNAVLIELNGRQEALVFNTLALQDIQDKYGGIQQLTEAFQGPADEEWHTDEEKAANRAARAGAEKNALPLAWWLVTLLANQGRMMADEDAQLLTEHAVALHTMPSDLERLLNACMEAIARGMGTYHVTEEQVSDPILEEVEKNVAGAGN